MDSNIVQCPFASNGLLHDESKIQFSKYKFFRVRHCLKRETSKSILYPTSADTSHQLKGSFRQVTALPDGSNLFWERSSTPILDMVDTPIHLKNLSIKDLKQLADEIRSEISFLMSKTDFPFKASLAAVELTIAIHHVFHAPADKILWDIGEQTYAHKLLTGRRFLMHTLKQKNGVSGFTSRFESEYDAFASGHGCNSVSAGLGMAVARDIKGKKDRIVTVISNWTTMAGQVYEAMSNAGYLDSNMVVILNDSRHSLHPKLEKGPKMTVNALSSTLSKLQSSKSFRKLREAAKGVTKSIGKGMHELAAKIDQYARGMIGPLGATLFEELGLYYIGPVDGHNIDDLICVLNEVASLDSTGPVLIHVITEEAKGSDSSLKRKITFEQQGTLAAGSLTSYSKFMTSNLFRTWNECFVEALNAEAGRDTKGKRNCIEKAAIQLLVARDRRKLRSFSHSLLQTHTPTVQMRHVAAIPYPGRGHVNSMVNLCRSLLLLSSNEEEEDLLISFVITEEWLSIISGDPPLPENLRLVTIPNVIPSELGRAKDLGGFVDAVCTKMEAPVEILMEAMELPVMGILADTMLPWAVKLGRRRDVPVFSLFPMSAALFWENVPGGEAEPIMKYISSHNSMQLSDARYNFTSEIEKRLMEIFSMLREVQAILFASFYELEPEVIDALRQNLHCPIYPIGPSIPYMMLDENPNNNDVDCMGWLNLQPKQSVLYVSLGSFLSVSDTQMDEIAMGLRLSGTPLLWAARGESSRLQEMVGSMGIVVPWCDQLKVLNHSSVGGFLTHCGWNFTMEAVFCGVPMITFPIFADQPVNSRLILDKWKVGLSLGGESAREIVVGQEASLVVKRLMDLDGAESKDVRKRAAKLQDFAHGAIVSGGLSMRIFILLLKTSL